MNEYLEFSNLKKKTALHHEGQLCKQNERSYCMFSLCTTVYFTSDDISSTVKTKLLDTCSARLSVRIMFKFTLK